MDIKIEAQGHPSQERLVTSYESRLTKKYAQYPFAKVAEVKVRLENKLETKVSLRMRVEKGGQLYASHTDKNENKALEEVIRKMNVLIEKYKEKHYSNSIGR